MQPAFFYNIIMKKLAIIFSLILLSKSAFSQIINFGHQHHSGMNTASFGVFRTDYDNFTDYFYWNDVSLEKDFYPTFYAGVDENYWNAGASAKYQDLKASLIFYEQISAYKDWPSNMTDLGLAFNIGLGEKLTFQGRYYDFCYSGGKGTAMPGGTVAYIFGEDEFKHRAAASIDWCFWFLGPWTADVMFPRMSVKYDWSRDSSNGVGASYMAAPPMKGVGNKTDVHKVATSHTFKFWAGTTKDIEDFTVGIRPDLHIVLNTANPTDLPKNKKGEVDDYNPFAKKGYNEFHFSLPVAISYHITEKVELVASVFFGLYYANFDHANFVDSAGNKKKYSGLGGSNNRGWVCEKGIGLGLIFDISPRASLQIGTKFIRVPELTGDETGNAFDNHLYTAENLSAANMAKAPLSVSGKFSL